MVAWLSTAFTAWSMSRGQWVFIATISALKLAILLGAAGPGHHHLGRTMVAIAEMFFVVFNLLSLSLGYFGPKGRIIYVLPERNTVAFFQAAIQGYSMDQG
ncbi:taste receptor type 1 member 2 [Crotalus adamanteus]|uniref:Taste receptor type 1 member 2 n=1 Tax=Crotalus adamanteus TaxID=8729 RepID=A0AAW1AQB5_CROAD